MNKKSIVTSRIEELQDKLNELYLEHQELMKANKNVKHIMEQIHAIEKLLVINKRFLNYDI